MRYLVKARVKAGSEKGLIKAIEAGTLGKGQLPVTNISMIWSRHGSVRTEPLTGLRPVIAQPHFKRSGRIGKNISSS
jgi:hypothetical protein